MKLGWLVVAILWATRVLGGGDLLAAETVTRPFGSIRPRMQEQAAQSKTTKAGDPDNGSRASDQLR
jgi:hypothetical protein